MTIEQRVEQLERKSDNALQRNRLLLAGATLCLLCALATWVLEPAGAFAEADAIVNREVRANSFLLVDNKGKTRADLNMFKGVPVLRLFDATGKTCVGLSAFEGGGLNFFDEKGSIRVSLDSLGLRLMDENEKSRVSLIFFDGKPSFTLSDRKGTGRVMLGLIENEPALALSDRNGNPRADLAFKEESGPCLHLFDGNAGLRTYIGIQKDNGVLVLWDENGKVRWPSP